MPYVAKAINMVDEPAGIFVHSITETGRLLPSGSRWNSIEIDVSLLPPSTTPSDSLPSKYSKSLEFTLTIRDRTRFRRFICATSSLVLLAVAALLLTALLPRKRPDVSSSKNIPLALSHALQFFDAQRCKQQATVMGFASLSCSINLVVFDRGKILMLIFSAGILAKSNYSVAFRGDSGLQDGNSEQTHADLVGGFYDSGNNVKFSFPIAYAISLLSWTVIEYHQKYEALGELDHVKDVIRWGTDYLLKLYIPSNSTSGSTILYSQASAQQLFTLIDGAKENDLTCWQRPEDMKYERPASVCRNSATDLAGEMMAALAASSMVFRQQESYSRKLIQTAQSLFEFVKKTRKFPETYSANECGKEARNFYNSSGYLDELAWGGTWLFFATGNYSYLEYATEKFVSASDTQSSANKGGFYWDNKLPATAVLLTRLRYLRDPGYPYEINLRISTDWASNLICSYVSPNRGFNMTPGGLIIINPNESGTLQFGVTAAFLTKVYNDYLKSLRIPGENCGFDFFSLQTLQTFSRSQASPKTTGSNTKQLQLVNYVLGDNPANMSYMVGFGESFPKRVHHRGGSIPWDGRHYTCEEGKRWRDRKDPNPNILRGAMVAGPDKDEKFFDERGWPAYTEPTLSGNAGLVAALVAVLEPQVPYLGWDDRNGGIDPDGIFLNLKLGDYS
ncbi:hypothetical protein Taro_035831 [Colocasia esculenta]|uniref:Endoglucanase n=1 Tax=Colocasia esculenta TaxID=4460 RepID=A0A843VZY9_COLES|nr:hypothetical protein [Colocasia esculenta]